MNINPYTVRTTATGPIEIVRDGKVIKTFGDLRKADGYARGLWDAELAIIKAIRNEANRRANAEWLCEGSKVQSFKRASDYIENGEWRNA